MTPAIAFRAVTREYGAQTVLRDLTLDIGAGEIYGLAGANGSGKTTLLRAAAGAIRPTSGTISVTGMTGYVAQKFSLYEDLLVEENLVFFARCYGLGGPSLPRAVSRALDRFDLGTLRRIRTGQLSHGWKQRVAFAAALCHQPSVLILDEATSGIDLQARFQIWKVLAECAAAGVGILLATHDMEELARCHRIGYLRDGQLIVSTTPDEVRSRCAAGLGRSPESLTQALAWFAGGDGG